MKILIVEDEIGIANFLKQGLEEEGYDVLVANDGKAGFELAQNNKIDIALLDWILPQMTGIEVCKAIREINPKIPIIFLTAKDTVQDTIEGLKSGANDYIKKPFSFDELVERIKIHFRSEELSDELNLGKIKIYQSKHQVFLENKEILLTQREFELLVYLIKNKGKVCSRSQIIEDVWDIHFDYDTGVIDVFMNAIRKKLNFHKDQELLKTIRGVGYMANEIN
jgi:DNA-binding response OmpR family regulator